MDTSHLPASSKSKAQASLNKILHTINSVKTPSFPRFDIDLNLSSVRPFSDSSDYNSEHGTDNLDACSFVAEKQFERDSSGNNNNNNNHDDDGEKTKEGSGSCSGVTATTTMKLDNDVEDENETNPLREQTEDGGNGNGDYCISLLIAAAELISSTEAELLAAAPLSQQKEVDDTPAVRSKRRRSQVLPHRFRDSVILLEESKRRR